MQPATQMIWKNLPEHIHHISVEVTLLYCCSVFVKKRMDIVAESKLIAVSIDAVETLITFDLQHLQQTLVTMNAGESVVENGWVFVLIANNKATFTEAEMKLNISLFK